MGFKFGDIVENGWASEDNPTRKGVVVKRGVTKGRLNPGPFVQLTDMKGEFWECGAGKDHKLSVVGSVLPDKALEADNTALRETLEFYADSLNYTMIYKGPGTDSRVNMDNGRRARKGRG